MNGIIGHIPETKKCASDAKRKIMKLFKAKVGNEKAKKVAGAFDDIYINGAIP